MSYLAKSGWVTSSRAITGTPPTALIFSRSTNRSASPASQRYISTIFPPPAVMA